MTLTPARRIRREEGAFDEVVIAGAARVSPDPFLRVSVLTTKS
jgi:hypothetical protein